MKLQKLVFIIPFRPFCHTDAHLLGYVIFVGVGYVTKLLVVFLD